MQVFYLWVLCVSVCVLLYIYNSSAQYKFTFYLLIGLEKSQSGATNRYPHLDIFLLALFSSMAEAEWSSFSRKQLEHLLLLNMFGENLRQSWFDIFNFFLYVTRYYYFVYSLYLHIKHSHTVLSTFNTFKYTIINHKI